MTPPALHVGWIAAAVVAVVAFILTLAERRAAPAGHFFAAKLDDAEGKAFTAAVHGLRSRGLRGLPVIRGWIGRMGVRADRRDDVLQDILETLWDLWPTFDPRRPTTERSRRFVRWVYGIVRRVVSHHRERMEVRDRREVLDEPLEHRDPKPLAPEIIEAEQARLDLIDRVQCLPPTLRRVIIAHDLDGIPMADVAAEIGVPLSSTYKLRVRALTELQADVEEGSALARERRRIVVHDLQGFREAPAHGYVSRLDVVRYLLANGWRRDGDWFLRSRNDVIEADAALPLLVSRIAAALDVAPRALLRAIEALAAKR